MVAQNIIPDLGSWKGRLPGYLDKPGLHIVQANLNYKVTPTHTYTSKTCQCCQILTAMTVLPLLTSICISITKYLKEITLTWKDLFGLMVLEVSVHVFLGSWVCANGRVMVSYSLKDVPSVTYILQQVAFLPRNTIVIISHTLGHKPTSDGIFQALSTFH